MQGACVCDYMRMRTPRLKLLIGIASVAAAALLFSSPAAAAAPETSEPITGTQAVTLPMTGAPVTVTTGISVPAGTNPAALAISQYYTVPLDEIEALRSLGSGWGYGNIVKVYAFAQAAGISPTLVIQMRASGMGWGQIAKELNLPRGAGNMNLGRIMKAVRTGQSADAPQTGEQTASQIRKPAKRTRVKPAPKAKPAPKKAKVKKPAPVKRVRPPKQRPQPPAQRVKPPKRKGR
jgi:hypothetical protein